MKVDVITRHAVPNYGSLLQTYATQKTLEKLGYEAEIIDYIRDDEKYKNLANSLVKGKKWDKNFALRSIYKLIQKPNYGTMYKKFEGFRKDFLNLSDVEYGNLDELKKNKPQADVYCSGSDQIWGAIGTDEYDPAYFLEFTDSKERCIAYSSSFGKTELNKELDKSLKQLLKKYETILVREDTAKDIIKEHGFDNVEQVLDPTLLLSKDEWNQICSKKTYKKKYVLVYQLHANKQFDEYAKKFAKKYNLKLLRLSPSLYHITRSGKLIYLPTQYEFLSYFKNAEYILTDSFHATVFSIIFNKKFSVVLPGKTSTRITSILRMTGLENRVVNDFEDYSLKNVDIEYKKVNKILEEKRNESVELLKNAIQGKINNIDLLNKHYKCCGCRACEQSCPKNAIKIVENTEGFFEPKVDYEKCINCGICLKICPQLNYQTKKNDFKQKAYAVKNKDLKERLDSSSGGVFSLLAKSILDKNGIVYGVAFNKKFEAEHIRVDDEKELYKLRGSKYVQSNTNNTYSLVKKDLENQKYVLYSGTSCQIEGLKHFLKKDYENLYTIDLVCHGVPSQKLFKKYIKYLEDKYKSKIINYNFRDKSKKGWGLNIRIDLENGKSKFISANLDPYFKSFLDSDTYMETCYKCNYANTNRVGDVTLADYWGVRRFYPDFYDLNGISAVLINSKRGKDLFENISSEINCVETQISKVVKENGNLKEPSSRSVTRNIAYNRVDDKKFKEIEKNNLKFHKKISDIIKEVIPQKLKNYIKVLLGIN